MINLQIHKTNLNKFGLLHQLFTTVLQTLLANKIKSKTLNQNNKYCKIKVQ